MLQDVRSHRVAFHTTDIRNHESIMKNGLIPQGKRNIEVDLASRDADRVRPSWVPDYVKRSEALYLYPIYHNSQFEINRKNTALDAVTLSDISKAWMGSQSIGGFMVYLEDWFDQEELMKTQEKENIEEHGPEYWSRSCSLEDYIKVTSHVRKKQKIDQLDEILYFEPFPKEEVSYLGYWDHNAVFHPEEAFKKFTRNNCDYEYIIKEYEKVSY